MKTQENVTSKCNAVTAAVNASVKHVAAANKIRKTAGTTIAALSGKCATLKSQVVKIEAAAAEAEKVCKQVERTKSKKVTAEEKAAAAVARKQMEIVATYAIARIGVAIATLQGIVDEKTAAAAAAKQAKAEIAKVFAITVKSKKENVRKSLKVDSTLSCYIKHLMLWHLNCQTPDAETLKDLGGVCDHIFGDLCDACEFDPDFEKSSINGIVKAICKRIVEKYPYRLASGGLAGFKTYVTMKDKGKNVTYIQAVPATPRDIVNFVIFAHVFRVEQKEMLFEQQQIDEEGKIEIYNIYRAEFSSAQREKAKFKFLSNRYRVTEGTVNNVVKAKLTRQLQRANDTAKKADEKINALELPVSASVDVE